MAKRQGCNKRPQVDWSKVPVVITGTPNPEAIRLIQESMWEFAYREWLKKQTLETPGSKRQVPSGAVVENDSLAS